MSTIDNIVTELDIFYQYVHELYTTNLEPKEKWTRIAEYMNNKNEIARNSFHVIKNLHERKVISLDYKTKYDLIVKQINAEADPLRKCSFIVLGLHHIIYDLATTEGNYYFSLSGKEEMNIFNNGENVCYYINLSEKIEQNIYFHAYFLVYALESLFNKYFYVGVDFEYTKKKIQLAQLNFEHSVVDKSIIMIVSPDELEPAMMENFIQMIMCNRCIKKILHGSDSLDIPYVYKGMLADDPDKIIKFTQALIDTRFLCEYYKLNLPDATDSRCAIYDEEPSRSAVYYFGLVSEEQQKKLSEVLNDLPAPHDIEWYIHKMPKSQVLYAQYDVIFLKYFYYKIINVATQQAQTDLEKKNIIRLYKYVLNEFTEFVYLENNGITFLRTKCKEEVDVVNNYFTRKQGQIIKMIDIYNMVAKDLVTNNPRVEIDSLLKVNHYKASITIITKRIVYGHISRLCRINKDKTTIWHEKLNNQFIFDFFAKLEFQYLENIFRDLNKILETKVKQFCSN